MTVLLQINFPGFVLHFLFMLVQLIHFPVILLSPTTHLTVVLIIQTNLINFLLFIFIPYLTIIEVIILVILIHYLAAIRHAVQPKLFHELIANQSTFILIEVIFINSSLILFILLFIVNRPVIDLNYFSNKFRYYERLSFI